MTEVDPIASKTPSNREKKIVDYDSHVSSLIKRQNKSVRMRRMVLSFILLSAITAIFFYIFSR